jgi:serine/threonine-protein kinase
MDDGTLDGVTVETLEPTAVDPTRAATLPPGARIGSYVIERKLGGGGGGSVYKARHELLDRPVALKLLQNEQPNMTERFIREARAVNQIRHPNIVDVFDFGHLGSRPFYAMELLEGHDLHRLIALQGRFTPRELLELLEPVLSAVQAAHECGYVHRDLKASNIMVCQKGEQRTVKLLDFGIAKALGGPEGHKGLTGPGEMLGTPPCMAPEQIRCEAIDCRADIYALGALIFHMLTGELPFGSADRSQVIVHHLTTPPPRPSDLVASAACLDEVVLRCMQKKPAQRYASAAALWAALKEAVGEVVPRPQAAEEALPRIAVVVRVHLTAEAEAEADARRDASEVMDVAEDALVRAGLTLTYGTASSLRAVTDERDPGARERVERAVEALRAELPARNNPHPGVRFELQVTSADDATR